MVAVAEANPEGGSTPAVTSISRAERPAEDFHLQAAVPARHTKEGESARTPLPPKQEAVLRGRLTSRPTGRSYLPRSHLITFSPTVFQYLRRQQFRIHFPEEALGRPTVSRYLRGQQLGMHLPDQRGF